MSSLKFRLSASSDVPNTDRHAELVLDRSGNFEFFVTVSPGFEAWRSNAFDSHGDEDMGMTLKVKRLMLKTVSGVRSA